MYRLHVPRQNTEIRTFRTIVKEADYFIIHFLI